VHLGHLVPAVRAFETFRFDALVFVPAAQPPHKLGEPMTPFSHRFAMLALATQSYDHFLVSPIEVERTGPTYTVDTLRLLQGRFAAEQAFFLMGSDSFSQIGTWSRWEELVDLAHLVVLHRDTVWARNSWRKCPPAFAREFARSSPSWAWRTRKVRRTRSTSSHTSPFRSRPHTCGSASGSA